MKLTEWVKNNFKEADRPEKQEIEDFKIIKNCENCRHWKKDIGILQSLLHYCQQHTKFDQYDCPIHPNKNFGCIHWMAI